MWDVCSSSIQVNNDQHYSQPTLRIRVVEDEFVCMCVCTNAQCQHYTEMDLLEWTVPIGTNQTKTNHCLLALIRSDCPLLYRKNKYLCETHKLDTKWERERKIESSMTTSSDSLHCNPIQCIQSPRIVKMQL